MNILMVVGSYVFRYISWLSENYAPHQGHKVVGKEELNAALWQVKESSLRLWKPPKLELGQLIKNSIRKINDIEVYLEFG